MIGDFTRVPEGSRKPLNYKDAVSKHQVCGAYLHLKAELQSRCPEKEWKAVVDEIDEAFFQQYLDVDLQMVLQQYIPPGDVNAIGAFRLDRFILGFAMTEHLFQQLT